MGAEDLAGMRFGKLVAVKWTGRRNESSFRIWQWRCDCGNVIERPSIHIKSGRQISCGCYRNQRNRTSNVIHGLSGSRTYRAWIAMKSRCRGSDARNKKYYADKGITVCRAWARSFQAFYESMGECPPDHSLERIRNEIGYRPGNCRWATQADQIRNTSRTIKVIIEGTEMCLKDACFAVGQNYQRVRSRIRNGTPPQQALL